MENTDFRELGRQLLTEFGSMHQRISRFADKALGGEILTIGSDAHCTADIGRDISAGVEMAQAAGFKYLTYFKKHEPKFIKIEI